MERFTKVRNIGKGNMGACTLARNNEDGRHYVIKQVDLGKLNKKERQQSLNEAKVLSSIRHPNVINYVDSFLARKSDHLCIVMEFADGGDLSAKVKNAHNINFTQEQVLDWSIQIALALQHITSKRILHRDVKTQNVFLTSDGVCKLGDFGIARTLNSTFDQASTFVGTPYYLSPELILERPYDAMSDTWAFGVCLYELMALRHPFNAPDMKSLMQRILRVQYDPPPTCYSAELRNIVTRLLTKDPGQRMKLTEFLDQPIVATRMKQWLQGGILPSRYISSLVRHKLLPPAVLATVVVPTSDAAAASSYADATKVTPTQTRSPAQARYAPPYPAVSGQEPVIRTEFRDVRLKPKPPPGLPMPTRDPGLYTPQQNHYQAAPVAQKLPPVRGALAALAAPPAPSSLVSDAMRRQSEEQPHVSRIPPRLAAIPGGRGLPSNVELERPIPPRAVGRLPAVAPLHPSGNQPVNRW